MSLAAISTFPINFATSLPLLPAMADSVGQPVAKRRRHTRSVASFEAEQMRVALRLKTRQSNVDHHGATDVIERILAKSSFSSVVKFGLVESQKTTGLPSGYGTAAPSLGDMSFRRVAAIVDHGFLIFGNDDFSPHAMSFLANIMVEKKVPITALEVCLSHLQLIFYNNFFSLQFHFMRLFRRHSDPHVRPRCDNLSALLKISSASIKRIIMDASYAEFPRRDRERPEIARLEGDSSHGCVPAASMAQHEHAFRSIPTYAVAPLMRFFTTLSSLLAGKFGQLPNLEELIIRWPTPWNLGSGWLAPRLLDIFAAAPNLRVLVLGQADLFHSSFGGAPLDSHPLHLGPIDDDGSEEGAKIHLSKLQVVTFGKTLFATVADRRHLARNVHHHRVLKLMDGSQPLSAYDMLLGVLCKLNTPNLCRLNLSTNSANVQEDAEQRLTVLGYRSRFSNFPAVFFDEFWYDARSEQRLSSSHGARRPPQHPTLLARVSAARMVDDDPRGPYQLVMAEPSDELPANEPKFTSWSTAKWCSPDRLMIDEGDPDSVDRRARENYAYGRRSPLRLVLLVVHNDETITPLTSAVIGSGDVVHYNNRCSVLNSPALTNASSVKLVIQSVESFAVTNSIWNLPADTRSKITHVILDWKLIHHPNGETKFDMQDCGDVLPIIPGGYTLSHGLLQARGMISYLRRALPHVSSLDVCFHLQCSWDEAWEATPNNPPVDLSASRDQLHYRMLLQRAAKFASDLHKASREDSYVLRATRSLPFKLRCVTVNNTHYDVNPRRFLCGHDGKDSQESFTDVLRTASRSGKEILQRFSLEYRRHVRHGVDQSDPKMKGISFSDSVQASIANDPDYDEYLPARN